MLHGNTKHRQCSRHIGMLSVYITQIDATTLVYIVMQFRHWDSCTTIQGISTTIKVRGPHLQPHPVRPPSHCPPTHCGLGVLPGHHPWSSEVHGPLDSQTRYLHQRCHTYKARLYHFARILTQTRSLSFVQFLMSLTMPWYITWYSSSLNSPLMCFLVAHS